MDAIQCMFGTLNQKYLTDMLVSNEDYLEKIINKIPIIKDDTDREKINSQNPLLTSVPEHTQDEAAEGNNKDESDKDHEIIDISQGEIPVKRASRRGSGRDQEILYSAIDEEFPVREKRSDSFVEKMKQGITNLFRKGSRELDLATNNGQDDSKVIEREQVKYDSYGSNNFKNFEAKENQHENSLGVKANQQSNLKGVRDSESKQVTGLLNNSANMRNRSVLGENTNQIDLSQQ